MQSIEQDAHGHHSLPKPSSTSDFDGASSHDNLQENAILTDHQDITTFPIKHSASQQATQQELTGLVDVESPEHTGHANEASISQGEVAGDEREASNASKSRRANFAADEYSQVREKEANRRSKVWGRSDIHWREDLTENGQKLYRLLMFQQGDRDLLPSIAQEEQFNLDAAVLELRNYGLLDEADPQLLKLISKEL